MSSVFVTLFSSSPLFFPCILWTTKVKDYEAPKLGFFINLSFPKALPWTIYSSPSFINCFGEHKAIKKHQNLAQLLETIARVPNMLIELKGNNYYSSVFKRDNYKLLNSMFWVVISNQVMSCSQLVHGFKQSIWNCSALLSNWRDDLSLL